MASSSTSPDERLQHLRLAIRSKKREIERLPDELVRGPRGQQITRREAGERSRVAKTIIDVDEVHRSLRHRTVSRWTKVLSLTFLVLIDFPVMLWLVSSVFNVDWSNPIGVPLVISVVLSVLGTAGAAWVLYHMGHNRREDKNDRRQLDWSKMSPAGRVSLVGVATLVTLISVVMFVRVFTEGVLSGLRGLAVLLAVLVALIMLLSAALVFFTAFRDGSPEQEDWARYSALSHDGQVRQHKLEDELDRYEHELAMLEPRGTSERRSDRGPGTAESSDSGPADQRPVTGPANAPATGGTSAGEAQVTRIHEVRPPHPPGRTRGTGTESGVADRPVP
jgi:uncharacterized membrane protein